MNAPPSGSPSPGGTSIVSTLLFVAIAVLLVWKVVIPMLSGGGC